MGVPAFFRWLTERYPKVVWNCAEDPEKAGPFNQSDSSSTTPRTAAAAPEPHDFLSSTIHVDLTTHNPNSIEFDNLYLDMNGIIHPCCHPEHQSAPPTEEDMIVEIFGYIDRLFSIVRPRNLVYMAIDGCAPRAKMNQQRSRRFRAAKDALEKHEIERGLLDELKELGYDVDTTPDDDDDDDDDDDEENGGGAGDDNGYDLNEGAINIATNGDQQTADTDSGLTQQVENTTPKQNQKKKQKKKTPLKFDTNVITPGTPFMNKVIQALIWYIHARLNYEPGWHNLKVILSDSNMPGEGEHKIMEFIRQERAQPGYNPNTRHVLYGLDADLIMLALATHEPHFFIIREEVGFNKQRHAPFGSERPKVFGTPLSISRHPNFQFLGISVLREYLRFEFDPQQFIQTANVPRFPFEYDFERIIDDFIFLCFFVGNDFLPHLPSLSIHEGSLEKLLELYKRHLPHLGAYLTHCGQVCVDRIEVIMREMGELEDEVFQRRREREMKARRRSEDDANRLRQQRAAAELAVSSGELTALGKRHRNSSDLINQNLAPTPPVLTQSELSNKAAAAQMRKSLLLSDLQVGRQPTLSAAAETLFEPAAKRPRLNNIESTGSAGQSAPLVVEGLGAPSQTGPVATPKAATLAADTSTLSSEFDVSVAELDSEQIESIDRTILEDVEKKQVSRIKSGEFTEKLKQRLQQYERVDAQEKDDPVRFGEDGWKERYYLRNFHFSYSDEEKRQNVVKAYLEGLLWVAHYYFHGCAAWGWYYPMHYAPFSSDMVNLSRYMPIEFQKGKPFRPFDQLLAVMPAASAHCLPEQYHWLMTKTESPISDFYPEDFEIDLLGKRFKYQGISLLPFIDEKRLLDAVKQVEDAHPLQGQDLVRNSPSHNLLFVHSSHPLGSVMSKLQPEDSSPSRVAIKSQGVVGYVRFHPQGGPVVSPMPEFVHDVPKDLTCSAIFELPPPVPHKSQLLHGLKFPPQVLQPQDYMFGNSTRQNRNRPYDGQAKFTSQSQQWRQQQQQQQQQPLQPRADHASNAAATPARVYPEGGAYNVPSFIHRGQTPQVYPQSIGYNAYAPAHPGIAGSSSTRFSSGSLSSSSPSSLPMMVPPAATATLQHQQQYQQSFQHQPPLTLTPYTAMPPSAFPYQPQQSREWIPPPPPPSQYQHPQPVYGTLPEWAVPGRGYSPQMSLPQYPQPMYAQPRLPLQPYSQPLQQFPHAQQQPLQQFPHAQQQPLQQPPLQQQLQQDEQKQKQLQQQYAVAQLFGVIPRSDPERDNREHR